MRMINKCIELGKRSVKYIILPHVCYNVAKYFATEYVDISEKQARDQLQRFSSAPLGSSLTYNAVRVPPKFDLQIIIPAYNVEAYLRECIESIINQETKYSFQIILIDDGSTDKTGKIADSFCDQRIQVVHQPNMGFSGARNTGLRIIDAKYIAFVDSDDWLPAGAIDALMDVAEGNKADIVQGGFFQVAEGVRVSRSFKETKQVVNAEGLYGQPWGKVFRSELWKELCFPEGYWFEDTILGFLVYPRVDKVWLIDKEVYAYRSNPNGITQTAKQKAKCIDTYWITEKMMEEYYQLGLPVNVHFINRFFKQVIVNANRVRKMPLNIKQAIFVLTCELHKKYFSEFKADAKYVSLQKALEKRDYGRYELFAKTHRW